MWETLLSQTRVSRGEGWRRGMRPHLSCWECPCLTRLWAQPSYAPPQPSLRAVPCCEPLCLHLVWAPSSLCAPTPQALSGPPSSAVHLGGGGGSHALSGQLPTTPHPTLPPAQLRLQLPLGGARRPAETLHEQGRALALVCRGKRAVLRHC